MQLDCVRRLGGTGREHGVDMKGDWFVTDAATEAGLNHAGSVRGTWLVEGLFVDPCNAEPSLAPTRCVPVPLLPSFLRQTTQV